MPPRLIVHAGFHKTGTSSVQQMLRDGQAALRPALRILTKRDMPAMCEAARAYAQAPGDVELAFFGYETARILETLDVDDPRCILMSSEDLSGHIPGRRGRVGYPAAPRLMARLLDTVRALWGAAPEVVFYFSTRGAHDWMRSCHTQHLRATRMRDDLASYCAWQAPHANLDAAVAAVAGAVPGTRVAHRALEQTRDMPQGPLTPLLDLADVPQPLRAALPPPAVANASLPEPLRAQLRLLNREIEDDTELRRRKRALIAAAHHGRSSRDTPGTQ
ncbi:hypothetical protein DL237_12045 [Pseudooceanicola sediminis]|uniref:Sulfotransferase family protein n=1 Tax=Pseudooceanicola sediminis TaxID=2211117 RepID=A0A399IZI5_9RHOB|nr:hypothetical protein [Pseudooceanicola sediminis]KAA2313566.1 hypothetical protein E0K93_12990 [Puniceibacterium sp. HSS470]RII38588.1 hypothetical protein DL237_12045 [Pseudooceanicola sediminis]|tara:strand:- start:18078 stop:18902 length:825 start_codon:yes stop_codon:yes gene_type:complete